MPPRSSCIAGCITPLFEGAACSAPKMPRNAQVSTFVRLSPSLFCKPRVWPALLSSLTVDFQFSEGFCRVFLLSGALVVSRRFAMCCCRKATFDVIRISCLSHVVVARGRGWNIIRTRASEEYGGKDFLTLLGGNERLKHALKSVCMYREKLFIVKKCYSSIYCIGGRENLPRKSK